MAGGLVGLLDDVAALAKLAAASIDDVGAAAGRATSKATALLIDDAAVTPQYVQGLAAKRELPIIAAIAKGSFRNKLLIVLPAALLLSQFLPWLLTPILMAGGGYLCYEAVHKIWGALSGAEHGHGDVQKTNENDIVAGAIRTDLILSAEIMVIALDEVADETFLSRAAILFVVAIAITVLVYGVVALIVKMDDLGLRLAQNDGASASFGKLLVRAMPRLMGLLETVGIAAMLWVGGHIELVGLDEFGLSAPYDLVHRLEELVHEAAGALGGFLAWSVNTAASAVVGLIVGAAVLAVVQLVSRQREGASSH